MRFFQVPGELSDGEGADMGLLQRSVLIHLVFKTKSATGFYRGAFG